MLIEPGAGAHTFDANSLAIEFLAESLSAHGRLGGNSGIRGTLMLEAARIRALTEFSYGRVLMYLSPNDVDRLATNVFGMTESPTDTFTMSDSLPYFGVLIDLDSTVTNDISPLEFRDCMVTDWTIYGRAPQFGEDGEPELILSEIGIIGSIENTNIAWPVSPPSLPTAAIDAPYIFADTTSGVTLNAAVREIQQFHLKIDWGTYVKYVNSLTAHSHRPTKRAIQLSVQLPLNSNNDDLYDLAAAGQAAQLFFTNGAYSSKFYFGRYSAPNNSPVIKGKREVPLEMHGIVTGTGATPDLYIVNDITT
jgi:hypothetical protein